MITFYIQSYRKDVLADYIEYMKKELGGKVISENECSANIQVSIKYAMIFASRCDGGFVDWCFINNFPFIMLDHVKFIEKPRMSSMWNSKLECLNGPP